MKEFSASTHGSKGTAQTVNGLADRSFCWSDISRVQRKSNRAVFERQLASYQSQFDNAAQFYLKGNEIF